MNQKTCTTLELDKIIGQLASYAAFSASEALLRALEPSGDREEVEHRQQQTSEARDLLDGHANVTVGGSRDIRPYVQDAVRGLVLQPENLLAIKITLLAGRDLRRAIVDSEAPFPLLEEIAYGIDDNPQLVARIGRVLSDDGEVLDSASAALAQIRRDLQIAHGRLEDRLRAIVNNSAFAPYLQEALITMRGGRYGIPVKGTCCGAKRISILRQRILGYSRGITFTAPIIVAFRGLISSIPVTSCRLLVITSNCKGVPIPALPNAQQAVKAEPLQTLALCWFQVNGLFPCDSP